MWTKLDDGLSSHQKLWRAARRLPGPDAFARALGAFCVALLHANRYLTDGHVPDDAFESADVTPDVVAALVAVHLVERDPARGGVVVHDFLEWNPSAAQVRARLARDRDRKRSRQGYVIPSITTGKNGAKTSKRTPMGFHADSARSSTITVRGSSSRAVPVPTRPVPGTYLP